MRKKNETILKQEKIITLLDNLEDWKLDEISKDSPDMNKLSKEDHAIIMECVWITLGKEEASKKEIKKGIKEIIILCTLENFRRKGFLFINKLGNYDKTDIGKMAYKELIKSKRLKFTMEGAD